MPRLTNDQWEEIKAEWIAGLVGVREIARTFGVDHKAITRKAETKGWPPRQEVSDVVLSLVPSNVPNGSKDPQVGTNTRIVLQAFDRVIHLLRMHRATVGTLHRAVYANLERVAAIVDKKLAAGQTLTLKQELMVAQILSSSANAVSKLIPLERRAFGLSNEEISEFDTYTPDQLDALENTIRKALG